MPVPQIAGLDQALALRQLGGRVELFQRVLRQFVAQYRAALPGLEQLLTQGEPGAARRAAHSLKGATASLGAVELTQRLVAFESAVDAHGEPDQVAAAGRAVIGSLGELIAAIAAALALPPA